MSRRSRDELKAIERIDKILAELDPVVQQRVVVYVVGTGTPKGHRRDLAGGAVVAVRVHNGGELMGTNPGYASVCECEACAERTPPRGHVTERPVDFDDGPPVDYDDDRQLVAGASAVVSVAAQLAAGKGRIDPASLAIEGLTDEERAGFLAALDEDKPPRVPDLPCPKCGSDNVLLCWVKSGKFGCGCEKCRAAAPEHFDRHCHRCGYDWVTTDMLDAGGPDG